ncbi:hypothetical protein BTH42_17405 [Burkholderia sp. SRS-W-2-2016]|nr:hypothetical protein BTH42_17405 [Burkholderia sp. SRS-W-2-2016]
MGSLFAVAYGRKTAGFCHCPAIVSALQAGRSADGAAHPARLSWPRAVVLRRAFSDVSQAIF